ncbi:MAG: alpha/beta hydrolase family protein [Acidimicrobiales bacterium]
MPPVKALLLAPGASASRDQSALVAVDEAVARTGVLVARIDFPYRLAGRRRPDPVTVLVETVVAEAGELAARAGAPAGAVALGGRSMGGRICSMAVAAGLSASALVLISYPLHPPGRPERLRVEHFPDIAVPCLFVSGTRDAFGTPGELGQATGEIGAPVTHIWIEGGDHSLRGRDVKVAEAVTGWLGSLD